MVKSQNENVSDNIENQNQIKTTRHTIITAFFLLQKMNNLSRERNNIGISTDKFICKILVSLNIPQSRFS